MQRKKRSTRCGVLSKRGGENECLVCGSSCRSERSGHSWRFYDHLTGDRHINSPLWVMLERIDANRGGQEFLAGQFRNDLPCPFGFTFIHHQRSLFWIQWRYIEVFSG